MEAQQNVLKAFINETVLQDYLRNDQRTTKSVYSENMSCSGFFNRTQQKPCQSKQISRSEFLNSSQKSNHSRLANDQKGLKMKRGKSGCKYNCSVQKTIKDTKNDSAISWIKPLTTNHRKPLGPRDLEKQNELLLQNIVQKERILKGLDKRIEMKMSQWLIFQAEVNRKMTACTNQLKTVTEQLKTQKQQLNALRLKISQSHSVFNTRCAQLSRRKQQVEELCKYVQQTTKNQDLMKSEFQVEKQTCRAQMTQFDTIRRGLEQRQRKLSEATDKIHSYEKEIIETLAQLDRRQVQISDRQKQLATLRDKHFAKSVQLDQRQKVIASYVNQLTDCISTLSAQRSSLFSINSNLERRCNQLQNLEIKLFRKVTDDSTTNELDRYLTDSTNIQTKTPVRRSKDSVALFTDRKGGGSKRREDHTTVIEEHSSDLLSDSPLTFEFSNLS